MTNMQSSEAAALLDEVGKRRHAIRRRMGNGWFELAVFGSALVAVALASLAGRRLGAAQGVVCIVVFAVAYLAVGLRYLRLRRQFGVSFGIFWGLLYSAAIFVVCNMAAWLLDGTTRSVALTVVPTVGVALIGVRVREPMLFGLGAVVLAGGLVGAVPGAPGWVSATVYGVGFLAVAAALLRRVDRDCDRADSAVA